MPPRRIVRRMNQDREAAYSDEESQIRAMEQVRGIRLASRALYGAMHQAFVTPDGSVERAAAMLALDEQIGYFLALPGNTSSTALLAIGRVATEVATELGAKAGLEGERLARQVDQSLLSGGFN